MLKNLFKRNKEKVEFVSLLPEVAQTMPIIPASKQQWKWAKEALENYKKVKEENQTTRFTHVARCPGILGITKTGWIQRAWQDIVIKTNGDGISYEWQTPINQSIIDSDHTWRWDYVSHHYEDLFGIYNPDKKCLKTVIKIQSPWMVYIPKGYYLMSMPLPYPDRHEWTAATGLLDPDYGPNFLNVQMFWNNLEGETVIPAGTPLCQYMLVKKHDVEGVVRSYEKRDIENLRLRATAIDCKYQSNYTMLKDLKWK